MGCDGPSKSESPILLEKLSTRNDHPQDPHNSDQCSYTCEGFLGVMGQSTVYGSNARVLGLDVRVSIRHIRWPHGKVINEHPPSICSQSRVSPCGVTTTTAATKERKKDPFIYMTSHTQSSTICCGLFLYCRLCRLYIKTLFYILPCILLYTTNYS